MSSVTDVRVPDIGDFKDVAVIEVLVQPGDTIQVEQSLVTVESDKASMEIPSTHAGVVKEVKVKLGDRVAEGSVLVTVEASGAGAAARLSSMSASSSLPTPAPGSWSPTSRSSAR